MNASEIAGISLSNLVKIFIEKNEYFYKYKHIFDIYYSLENYKKYICDVRVKKDYRLLIDLVSRENVIDYNSPFKNGVNIFILEEESVGNDDKKISLLCLKNYDLQNNIKDKRKNIFLLKNNNLFENIVFVKKFSHMDNHQDPWIY